MLLRGSICLGFEEVVPCRSIGKEKIRVMCWKKSQPTLCMAGLSAPKTQFLIKTFKNCNKLFLLYIYIYVTYRHAAFPNGKSFAKDTKQPLCNVTRKTFPWHSVRKALPCIINSNRQEGNGNKCHSVNKGTKAGQQKVPFWTSSTFPKF